MWPFGKSLTQRAQDALNAFPQLQQLGLSVQDNHGNLSVSGSVPREAHKKLVQVSLEGLKGAKSVDIDNITVDEPAEPAAVEAEVAEVEAAIVKSAVAKAVVAAFDANVELKDDPIDVLQSGSNVVLRGAVDSQHEYNLAIQLAKGAGAAEVDADDLKIHEGAKARFAAEKAAPAPVNIPDEWYTVQSGDTLGGIAKHFYGDASKYTVIAKANGIANPDLIKVGQKLQIPR